MKFLFLFGKRKSVGIAIAILAILLIGMLIYPVGYGIIRLGIVGSVILIYLGFLYLVWNRRFLKYSWIALAIAFCAVMISPGRPSDAIALRDRYVRKLIDYDRVVYVYGGENELGIDCSGLVREALVKAEIEIGVLTANPDLLRRAFEIWWFDAGADALRDGYRNFTHRILFTSSINALNYDKMLKGDLAVSEDGGHILAYEGDKKWIEAIPEANRVVRFQAPDLLRTNPIYLVRWTELS